MTDFLQMVKNRVFVKIGFTPPILKKLPEFENKKIICIIPLFLAKKRGIKLLDSTLSYKDTGEASRISLVIFFYTL